MQPLPLKVAFLSPAWPPDAAANGIVSYVAGMREALLRQGHTVCILSPYSDEANPPTDIYPIHRGRRSFLLRISDGLRTRFDPIAAARHKFGRQIVQTAKRAISERGVQLFEMEETFGLVQLVKPRLTIPVVAKLHGPHFLNGAAAGLPFNAAFRRRVRDEGIGIARANAVSAPSRDVLERTRAYYGIALAEAAVIPCPAPSIGLEHRWSAISCDPHRLLFIGRFDRHKGGDVVIDSFRIVARRFPRIRLWFVGSDTGFSDDQSRHWTLGDYIRDRASDVADRIDWLGRQPNSLLPDLRREAFITIVGSRYENLPMVVLEALAHGCPIAATRAGGIVEIVQDGVNGVLAQPGDANDLAAAISRLLDAPEFAAKLGRQAAEDAAYRYNSDRIARETSTFHQSVLDKWGLCRRR